MCDLSGRVHWDVWLTDQLQPISRCRPPVSSSQLGGHSHIVMSQRDWFWIGPSPRPVLRQSGVPGGKIVGPPPPLPDFGALSTNSLWCSGLPYSLLAARLNFYSFCKMTSSNKILVSEHLHFIAVCFILICSTPASPVYITITTVMVGSWTTTKNRTHT